MIWAEVPVDTEGQSVEGWRLADAGRPSRWLRSERNLDDDDDEKPVH